MSIIFFLERRKILKSTFIIIGLIFLTNILLIACRGNSYKCEDPLGCVSYTYEEKIRIASVLAISGPDNESGIDSQHGVEIAIEFRDNIYGHSIELQEEDDGCNAGGGQIVGQKIVSDPTIVAVVGNSCSNDLISLMDIISEAGYSMISPSDTNPSLTDPAQSWKPGYLRTSSNDNFRGSAMAEFAVNILGINNAAVIHTGDPSTESLTQEFADTFRELGGRIDEFPIINKGDNELLPYLTLIAENGPPELLYYPGATVDGINLTRQIKQVAGLENTILSTSDILISNDAIDSFKEAGEGIYISSLNLNLSGYFYERFLETYEEKFGFKPKSIMHAYAFDATNIILDCLDEVAIKENINTLHIGRQTLRECLYSTSGFNGLTGILTCSDYGDCANPEYKVTKIQNGEVIQVWP